MTKFVNILRSRKTAALAVINKPLRLFLWTPLNMNVKISEKGREVINNKELAAKLVMTVVNNKSELEKGQVVRVDNAQIGVRFVTTMPENQPCKHK